MPISHRSVSRSDTLYAYHPVTRDDLVEFRDRINELVVLGYIPLGEPKTFEREINGEKKTLYLQFMISPSLQSAISKFSNYG